jgi:hypothetical protein
MESRGESPYIVKFGDVDQLHASDTLSLGKKLLVPMEQEKALGLVARRNFLTLPASY